jgi:hypothetical protein
MSVMWEVGPILSDEWVGVIIAASAVFFAGTNFFYTRKKDRFNSLSQAFNYLNDLKHKEARRVLYYYSKQAEDEKGERKRCDIITSLKIILGFDIPFHKALPFYKERLVRVSTDIVRDDMEEMGLMIRSKLIPEKKFLERYWPAVVDCRWLLNDNIVRRRKAREYNLYDIDFDYLTDKACKYAKKRKLISKNSEWNIRCGFKMKQGCICYHSSADRSDEQARWWRRWRWWRNR